MNILLWHVHGSWTTAFVQGNHTYLLPVLPDRGPDGRGRAQTWDWPPTVKEITPDQARQAEVDVVIMQRPEELHGEVNRWTGRRPGAEVPAVYLEHNAPEGPVDGMRHPAADRPDLVVVHVTHFNRLFWDTGSTRTVVVEHGIVDPGYRYGGGRAAAAVVVNDPLRRGRVVGRDLLDHFRSVTDVDLFGMRSEPLGGSDLPQHALHAVLGERRVYLHPFRWTSLGLSLLEAMAIGMPVVALATTEVGEAVPRDAGFVSNDVTALDASLLELMHDPDLARSMGERGRRAVSERYGLRRFLDDWDRVLGEVVA